MSVTKNPDGTYSFTQPGSKVTVKATFKKTAPDDGPKPCPKDDTCPLTPFNDLDKNAWYHDGVHFVLENGVMAGYSADTFGPDNTLTRAMVVQVLYNKENKPQTDDPNPFTDVPADQWYFNAVRWGAARNVVAGFGGNVFKPDDNVTIEQVAVILHNYTGKPASAGDASVLGAHSDWAEPALIWATEKGILRDLPYDAVTAPATRAQTAQMLMNYLQNA